MGRNPEEVRTEIKQSEQQQVAAQGDQNRYIFSSQYWVFVDEPTGPRAVSVITGLTDLDYSEVLDGIAGEDQVLMLPSSGLIRSQERFQNMMRQFSAIPGITSKSKSKDKNEAKSKSKSKDKNKPEN